jgi:hypothetical protein
MTKGIVDEIVGYGTEHFEFCMELLRIQMDRVLYFLFEHPASATSWNNKKVQDILKGERVKRVDGHMCQFGMQQEDGEGIGWIKKPTGFMTNCEGIAKRLSKSCKDIHRHIPLLGGESKEGRNIPGWVVQIDNCWIARADASRWQDRVRINREHEQK